MYSPGLHECGGVGTSSRHQVSQEWAVGGGWGRVSDEVVRQMSAGLLWDEQCCDNGCELYRQRYEAVMNWCVGVVGVMTGGWWLWKYMGSAEKRVWCDFRRRTETAMSAVSWACHAERAGPAAVHAWTRLRARRIERGVIRTYVTRWVHTWVHHYKIAITTSNLRMTNLQHLVVGNHAQVGWGIVGLQL